MVTSVHTSWPCLHLLECAQCTPDRTVRSAQTCFALLGIRTRWTNAKQTVIGMWSDGVERINLDEAVDGIRQRPLEFEGIPWCWLWPVPELNAATTLRHSGCNKRRPREQFASADSNRDSDITASALKIALKWELELLSWTYRTETNAVLALAHNGPRRATESGRCFQLQLDQA